MSALDLEACEGAFGGNPNCPANTSEIYDAIEDALAGDERAIRFLQALGWALS